MTAAVVTCAARAVADVAAPAQGHAPAHLDYPSEEGVAAVADFVAVAAAVAGIVAVVADYFVAVVASSFAVG